MKTTISNVIPGAGSDFFLYTPASEKLSYLIDRSNSVVHTWPSEYRPGMDAKLQQDGSILRPGYSAGKENRFVQAWAAIESPFNLGGCVERIGKQGECRWSYLSHNDRRINHHDFDVLPNGNVLLLVWDYKPYAESLAAGRIPDQLTPEGLWPESIVEVRPTGPQEGEVVWEWASWNHLVQDYDPTLSNFGKPQANPGKININYVTRKDVEGLAPPADIMHCDGIRYNKEHDQIVVSSFLYRELWVIDHSTTTQEAASDSGGRYGKGGQLLYRWGNPAAYGHLHSDHYTFLGPVHNANWGTNGHFWMFDNNTAKDGSKILEIVPPQNPDGSYHLGADGIYGPKAPIWSADLGFYSAGMGTAERLPEGAVSSCDCVQGSVVVVEPDGSVGPAQDLTAAQGMPRVILGPHSLQILGYSKDFAGIKALNL